MTETPPRDKPQRVFVDADAYQLDEALGNSTRNLFEQSSLRVLLQPGTRTLSKRIRWGEGGGE